MKNIGWWVAGGVAAAVGIIAYEEHKAAAAPKTPTTSSTPPGQPTPTGSNKITLSPGVPVSTQNSTIGQQITIALPVGATWLTQNGVASSGNAPITWIYQGPGSLSYTWSDSSGATQTSHLTFVTS